MPYLERVVIENVPDTDHEKLHMSFHLGKSLLGLYEQGYDLNDLEKAFTSLRTPVTLISSDPSASEDPRSTSMYNLFAVCCARMFYHTGSMKHLSCAIGGS